MNTYTVTDTELTSIADAIKNKAGIASSLQYPNGFISAIETLGGVDVEDGIITRRISGTYENSRVTTIGSNAFSHCSRLTTVNFPACTNISSTAFAYCSSLTSVNFPACTNIDNNALAYCSRLTSVNFPACTNIGNTAFGYCRSLTSVNFPACTNIGNNAFSHCSGLTSVNFPACTNIGNTAFGYCSRLTTVNFPACTNISSTAFRACHTLISFYLTGSSYVSLVNSNAFNSTPIGGYSASAGQYGSIYVPASMLESYKTRTNWTYFSSRFVGV